jgi:hypothetical protein
MPIPPIEPFKPRSSSKDLGLKARFSDPPNPPPQAPLPDKPPFELGDINSYLRRSETEKPRLANGTQAQSPQEKPEQGSTSQVETLSEALRSAKKEYDMQTRRLRAMEELLVQERVKRETAEEKAKKLESERLGDSKSINGVLHKPEEERPSTPIEEEANSEIGKKLDDRDTVAKKLQQRLETLLLEFQEYKASAEKWRDEKEKAEQERDEERKEKHSLMEMVETIRKEQRERTERRDGKKRDSKVDDATSTAPSAPEHSSESDSAIASSRSRGLSNPLSPLARSLFANGNLSSALVQSDKDGGAYDLRTGQLVQAAPYISAMSVVLIGVAVMALVNKMSRGER